MGPHTGVVKHAQTWHWQGPVVQCWCDIWKNSLYSYRGLKPSWTFLVLLDVLNFCRVKGIEGNLQKAIIYIFSLRFFFFFNFIRPYFAFFSHPIALPACRWMHVILRLFSVIFPGSKFSAYSRYFCIPKIYDAVFGLLNSIPSAPSICSALHSLFGVTFLHYGKRRMWSIGEGFLLMALQPWWQVATDWANLFSQSFSL